MAHAADPIKRQRLFEESKKHLDDIYDGDGRVNIHLMRWALDTVAEGDDPSKIQHPLMRAYRESCLA